MTIIHNPGNSYPVKELYAVLSVDEKGNEGIVGAPLPLVAGDPKLLHVFREQIKRLKIAMPGSQFRIVKFTHREIIDDDTGARA